MLENIHFYPQVDIPLALLTLLGFLVNFQIWVHRRDAETSVDLASRLPWARFRVIVLMSALLMFCWGTDLAFWSILALMLVAGAILAILVGEEINGAAVMLVFAAWTIREWAFGFPQLRLQPPKEQGLSTSRAIDLEFTEGMEGTTQTALRPFGEAEFDGTRQRVASDDGTLIQRGARVIATQKRNGVLYVQEIGEEKLNSS